MENKEYKQVITWQSPDGEDRIDICVDCEDDLHRADDWPRTRHGQELCDISRGKHWGLCGICQKQKIEQLQGIPLDLEAGIYED